jgi:hypothetical protein
MLELDPSKRITAEEALKHNYFREEPVKCEPKDLPKIEKDSHEFQSRQNKKQMQAQNQRQPQQLNQNNSEMVIGRQGYNNPNYYNKNIVEARFKIEETKVVHAQGSQQTSSNFTTSSRLEALITNTSQAENNSLIGNKRQMESSKEDESANIKKPKFSPDK